MSLLRLEDLYQDQEKRKKRNHQVYEYILKQCHRRIQLVNRKLKIFECWFRIPSYVFGYPAFDVPDVTEYICQKLSKNGLTVYYIEDGLIYIMWDPEHIDYERYQKTINRSNKLHIKEDIDLGIPDLFPSINPPSIKKSSTKTKSRKNISMHEDERKNVAVMQYDPSLDDLIPINTKKIPRSDTPNNSFGKKFPWN